MAMACCCRAAAQLRLAQGRLSWTHCCTLCRRAIPCSFALLHTSAAAHMFALALHEPRLHARERTRRSSR